MGSADLFAVALIVPFIWSFFTNSVGWFNRMGVQPCASVLRVSFHGKLLWMFFPSTVLLSSHVSYVTALNGESPEVQLSACTGQFAYGTCAVSFLRRLTT